MPLDTLLTNAILYAFIPLWIASGFGDWLCHRKTRISETAGTKESLLHLLMITQIGVPMLAGLFLEINALILAIMIAGLVAHEATVLWDLRYAGSKRTIIPIEQIIHSFQELLPMLLLTLVAFLHWDQFSALATLSERAEFRLEWKRHPLPATYLATLLASVALLIWLPFLEELWRCLRAETRRVAGDPTDRRRT